MCWVTRGPAFLLTLVTIGESLNVSVLPFFPSCLFLNQKGHRSLRMVHVRPCQKWEFYYNIYFA